MLQGYTSDCNSFIANPVPFCNSLPLPTTHKQLAERVDLAARYISLIEVGRSSPSLETIDSIAATLGVELKELFNFMHLDPKTVAPEQMIKQLATVDERDRQILYRLMEWMGKRD